MTDSGLLRIPSFAAKRLPRCITVPDKRMRSRPSRIPSRPKSPRYPQAINLNRSAALGCYRAIPRRASIVVLEFTGP